MHRKITITLHIQHDDLVSAEENGLLTDTIRRLLHRHLSLHSVDEDTILHDANGRPIGTVVNSRARD